MQLREKHETRVETPTPERPSHAEVEAAFRRTIDLALEYLRESADPAEPVSTAIPPDRLRELLDLDLPAEGTELARLLPVIESYFEHATRTGSPLFLNQLFSGQEPAGMLGEIVSAVTNTSMYTFEAAPVATILETELIRRMAKLVGFRDGEGLFVTGGSNANMVAMLCARQRIDAASKRRGLSGRRYTAFVSEQAHYSFLTAANLLGIGTESVVQVASDATGRMIPSELDDAIRRDRDDGGSPFFVGATAGTTVLGAFDPLEPIAQIARRHDVWMHVDGAWGAPVLFSEKLRSRLAGAELADSFAWDAHKLMGVPLLCTAILLRERGALRSACSSAGTEYIYHDNPDDSRDLGPLSLACGRKVDALKLWLAWKHHGVEGYARRVEHLVALAEETRRYLDAHPRFEMMAEPSFLNLCFRYVPEAEDLTPAQVDDLNVRIRDRLAASGRALINYANHDDRVTIRLVLPNPTLDLEQVVSLLEEFAELGRATEVDDADAIRDVV